MLRFKFNALKKLGIALCLATQIIAPSIDVAKASETEPRGAIYACDGSYTEVVSLSSAYDELIYATDVWAAPGQTFTATSGISDSMSNAAAISLIPELVEYNIARTVSISASYSISMTNTSSYDRQVGVYRKYKIVTYDNYLSQGNGYCDLIRNRTYKVYVGYKLDWC